MVANCRSRSAKDRLMLGYFQTFLLHLKSILDNPSEENQYSGVLTMAESTHTHAG
jgi:hypothetical protein